MFWDVKAFSLYIIYPNSILYLQQSFANIKSKKIKDGNLFFSCFSQLLSCNLPGILSGFWYMISSFFCTFCSGKQLDILATNTVMRDVESQTQGLTYIDLVLINYFIMSTTGAMQNVSKTTKFQNLSKNISDTDNFCRKSNASNRKKSIFRSVR